MIHETKLAGWNVPECPFAIDYSVAAMEEIRAAVITGFQRLARGGLEVGGVMFGQWENNRLQILAARPIECEHARGPGFQLTERDRLGLSQLLQTYSTDRLLNGLVPVGFYLSHTRSDICLADSDQEIYNHFFPAPWQVVLVLRPGRHGGTRAGFFFRAADGSLRAERSYQEFSLAESPGAAVRPGAGRLPQPEKPAHLEERRSGLPEQEPAPRPAPPARPAPPFPLQAQLPLDVPQFLAEHMPEQSPRRARWPWLLLAATIAAAALLGWRFYQASNTLIPLHLQVQEHGGQLQIEWDRTAKPVVTASRGLLEIKDGKMPSIASPLTSDQLTNMGPFTYARSSGDVEVRLTVFSPTNQRTEEMTRFLGQSAPVPQQPIGPDGDLRKERDALAAQVEQLKRELQKEQQNSQSLQRTIKILETRLGVSGR